MDILANFLVDLAVIAVYNSWLYALLMATLMCTTYCIHIHIHTQWSKHFLRSDVASHTDTQVRTIEIISKLV